MTLAIAISVSAIAGCVGWIFGLVVGFAAGVRMEARTSDRCQQIVMRASLESIGRVSKAATLAIREGR